MKAKVLGILGGGQLARMLCEAARDLGVRSVVLGSSDRDPAANVCDEFHVYDVRDPQSYLNVLQKLDVLTFENEFIPVPIVESAVRDCGKAITVAPSFAAVSVAQNKLRQKELFHRLHIETARHVIVENSDDLVEAHERLGDRYVLKWSMFGYDGKGNFNVSGPPDHQSALEFIKKGAERGAKTYAEAFVEFEHEAAMVFTRSRGGNFVHFPLVKTVQSNGACKTVEGPVTRMGWSPQLESQAVQIGHLIGEFLQLAGSYAVEFFVQGQRLIANEMAPRVHNSCHYSLNALEVSQFENHIRSICGFTLRDPGRQGYFGMVNLLGPEELVIEQFRRHPEILVWVRNQKGDLDKRLSPYWYHKEEIRPGRKLGHINVRADSLPELFDAMMLAQEAEKRLWQKLKQENAPQNG